MSDTVADDFQDYFAGDAHVHHFEQTYKRVWDQLTSVGLTSGVLPSISEAQATAAAVANYYAQLGLKENGAAYFNGLIEHIQAAGTETKADGG